MTGVLPDFLAVYDSCAGLYAVWGAFLVFVGAPALAAVLYAEGRGIAASLRYDARERRAAYVTHREQVCARLVRYTSTATSTPVLAACAALAVTAQSPAQSPAVRETIGQGCPGSESASLDYLRPTHIIPCVVCGVCRYRDAATGRFVRFNAADLPV